MSKYQCRREDVQRYGFPKSVILSVFICVHPWLKIKYKTLKGDDVLDIQFLVSDFLNFTLLILHFTFFSPFTIQQRVS